jgi:hypothetical protein
MGQRHTHSQQFKAQFLEVYNGDKAQRRRDDDVGLRRAGQTAHGKAQGRPRQRCGFATAAEAIRFAVEDFPAIRALGA